MTDAFYAILTFVVGAVLGYLVTKRTVGERRWRDGYLYGFNLAWDEKAKIDRETQERRLKELRRRRPSFKVIRGGDDVRRS